jgi:hypothetical protein
MAIPFLTPLWEEVREVRGIGGGGDNGPIKVEMGILPHLGRSGGCDNGGFHFPSQARKPPSHLFQPVTQEHRLEIHVVQSQRRLA